MVFLLPVAGLGLNRWYWWILAYALYLFLTLNIPEKWFTGRGHRLWDVAYLAIIDSFVIAIAWPEWQRGNQGIALLIMSILIAVNLYVALGKRARARFLG